MYLILKHQLYKNKTIQFVDTKTFKFESLQYTARLTTETGIITNRIYFYCISTFFFPPPGTWPMFFREPTLDWTFAKSAFSDLISSFPPPETQTHTHTHIALLMMQYTGVHLRRSSGGMVAGCVTWNVVDVVFGATLWCHITDVQLLTDDMNLQADRRACVCVCGY